MFLRARLGAATQGRRRHRRTGEGRAPDLGGRGALDCPHRNRDLRKFLDAILTRYSFSAGGRSSTLDWVLCQICSNETRSARFGWEATSASHGSSCAARSVASNRSLPGLRAEAFPRVEIDTGVGGLRSTSRASPGSLSWSRCVMRSPSGSQGRAPRYQRQDELETRNRELLRRMLAAPAEHKWVRVSREDLGEPGCGHWHSRPRLGPLGMLMGWWRVKVSSGCPLSARLRPLSAKDTKTETEERPPAPWGNFPLAELTVLGGIIMLAVGIFTASSLRDRRGGGPRRARWSRGRRARALCRLSLAYDAARRHGLRARRRRALLSGRS